MEGTMGSIRDEEYAFASERVDRQGTFRSEYLDFDRGIRVGHLAVEERLTQIIKSRLTERYGVRMLCDRWGRGMYWQWLCWVPEPNKKAKPLSAGHNFGSTKFQTPPDLVVKSQPIDIVAVISWPVLRLHVVYQREIEG